MPEDRLEKELDSCKLELQYYKGFHDGVKELIGDTKEISTKKLMEQIEKDFKNTIFGGTII